MARPSSRDRILDALQRILVEDGLHAVTLESVADAAGISKGGLLYHFPTKEALITALARRLAEAADAEFEQAEHTPDVVGYFLEASVPSSSDRALFWSLLAALRTKDVANAEARRLIVSCFVRWAEILRRRINDPVTSEIVRLVGDGLYLTALAGLPMPDDEELQRLRSRLGELAASAVVDPARRR